MSFDEIKSEIQDLPQTWIPALLKVMVETAVEKHVFQPGGIARFVKAVEDDYQPKDPPPPGFAD